MTRTDILIRQPEHRQPDLSLGVEGDEDQEVEEFLDMVDEVG